MATRDELAEKAKTQGFDVKKNTTKAELEEFLSTSSAPETVTAGGEESAPTAETQEVETVEVNENESGEATNGTTQDGSDSPVQNTDSIPQNGVETVEVVETTDNQVAKDADNARTKEEVKFADESNPNLKSRVNSTQGDEYDQTGNPRTGGKSYGIADDDIAGTVPSEENRGKAPEGDDSESYTGRVSSVAVQPGSFLNSDTNAQEWDVKKQREEEKSLSDPEAGIAARVLTSTGNYVRVKFFHNNLPLGTFRSRDYDTGKAKEFLSKLKKEQGL